MKIFWVSHLLIFQSSTSNMNGLIFCNNHQMVNAIFPPFSLSGYTIPIESFLIMMFICLVIFLAIGYYLGLHFSEKFKLTINMLQAMHVHLKFLKDQLEDISMEKTSDSFSLPLKQAIKTTDFIINDIQAILSLDKISWKITPVTSSTSIELSTYIFSMVDRCRPYADFHQVRLSVDECSNYADCKVKENILTATLQHLLNKIIEITDAGSCLHINVSHTVNSWKLCISNCEGSGMFSHERKFPFIPSLFLLYNYNKFRMIRKIIRSHGGKMNVHRHGKTMTFYIVMPINLCSKSQMNASINKQMINSKDYLEENEVVSVYQPIAPVSQKNDISSVLLITSNRRFGEYLKEALAKYIDISILDHPDLAVNASVQTHSDVIVWDEIVKNVLGAELYTQIKCKQEMVNMSVMFSMRSDDSESYLLYMPHGTDKLELCPEGVSKFRTNLAMLINCYEKWEVRQQKERLQKTVPISMPAKNKEDMVDPEFVKGVTFIVKDTVDKGETITVEMICQYMKMSATSFRTKMAKNFGMSPAKYIYVCKMERAAELLCVKKLNISDIAYLLGYSDARYFGKKFKKYYHISPTKYRDEKKKQESISSSVAEKNDSIQ